MDILPVDIVKHHELINNRLVALETDMSSMKNKVAYISDGTDQILELMQNAKSVGGFVAKHGPRAISFIVGIAATLGVLSPKVVMFLNAVSGAIK